MLSILGTRALMSARENGKTLGIGETCTNGGVSGSRNVNADPRIISHVVHFTRMQSSLVLYRPLGSFSPFLVVCFFLFVIRVLVVQRENTSDSYRRTCRARQKLFSSASPTYCSRDTFPGLLQARHGRKEASES